MDPFEVLSHDNGELRVWQATLKTEQKKRLEGRKDKFVVELPRGEFSLSLKVDMPYILL